MPVEKSHDAICSLYFGKECDCGFHGGVYPTIQKFQEPGLKFDGGKTDLSLLPYESLEEIAKVLEFGATKYGRSNWRKGMTWSRLIGAVLRHVFAWSHGERFDPETGLSHLAHASCGLLFLLSYEKTGKGTDDLRVPND